MFSVFISDTDTAKLYFQFQQQNNPNCICNRQDYWSINRTSPPKDAVNNFELVEATEMAGYTSVKFERNLTTGEANKDVQFTVRLYNKYSSIMCG